MKQSYLFVSERLGFRAWEEKDIAPFFEMCQDDLVMEFFPAKLSWEQCQVIPERFNACLQEDGYTFYAVDLLSTGEFIGFIGLLKTTFEAAFTPCTEIGWRLKTDVWNKGLATEGAKRCLKFAKEELLLTSIYSFTPHSNKRSERIMQKIGMNLEGQFFHPKIDKGSHLNPHLLYKINL